MAVTLGDPRGIGPEVAFRAARSVSDQVEEGLVFVGPPELLSTAPAGSTIVAVDGWDGTEEGAGRVSVLAIQAAVGMALTGAASAVVTAPVHKPALHRAGWRVPGQTELLQQLTSAPTVGMLMAAERTRLGGALRVLLATTHLALRDVAAALTTDLVVAQALLLQSALREGWGMSAPRLALCALNPHASDDGLFGDEEVRVLAPAVERLRARGVDVSQPIPADTVFARAVGGAFDAVVAPYHDVGMAAFKTASFGAGVNVTLGLPFVRTSPDHGTAFDLAARPGAADPASMIEAILLAVRLSRSRFDTGVERV